MGIIYEVRGALLKLCDTIDKRARDGFAAVRAIGLEPIRSCMLSGIRRHPVAASQAPCILQSGSTVVPARTTCSDPPKVTSHLKCGFGKHCYLNQFRCLGVRSRQTIPSTSPAWIVCLPQTLTA